MPDNIYDAIIGCAEDLKSGAEVNREAWLDYIVRYANEAKGKEADLRAKLKVAEDALLGCMGGMCRECRQMRPGYFCRCREISKAKEALAAIAEEGGES